MRMNLDLFVGQSGKLGKDIQSAIFKHKQQQALLLSRQGFAGDEQADQKHHGGPDRALHIYPQEHYAYWQQQYPEHPDFVPGAFGENISLTGMTEEQVCIGDVFQIGQATVQISQPRSPCFKLNLRFGVPDMALQLQLTGRAGYLLRVLEPGLVTPGDSVSLLQRNWPELTVRIVAWQFFNHPLNSLFLKQLLACDALSASWQAKARLRLEQGYVEDWSKRLFGFLPRS
ncbi:MOSC domain-containing protein [Bowmanella denitrificans]|uniref:MOSC domain-containing protein n=1 Tax=Bowmanella denitrificans TaxID=366582 RepID=UPI001C0F1BE8|nr:MOSC domain-containing protein [Bowmanella denitrificans]